MYMNSPYQLLRFFAATLSLLVMQTSHAQKTLETAALIPMPVSWQQGNGIYILSGPVRVNLPAGDSLKFLGNLITSRLTAATGMEATVTASGGQIQLLLNKRTDAAIGKEGYQLTVDANGVQIKANTAAGLFYAVQTLWQLFPAAIESKTAVTGVQWGLPYASITDKPRFGYRGLMLDVARHFFSKQQVKDFIDNMVKYKYNFLHLHLTDDQGWRLEIKSLPKLVEVGAFHAERTGPFGDFKKQDPSESRTYGGYYTHEDIRELVAYARERFVTILPEIDIPGHSMALVAAYPELSCTPGTYTVSVGDRFMIWPPTGHFYGLVDNNICPSSEIVYQYLDKIFTEVAQLFPYEYIHMGGDETYKGFWEKSDAVKALMTKEKLKDMNEVQSYFVKRVSKIIASKGKKMFGWDEIMEGGLAPGAAVMSWRGEKGGIEAAKMKHQVVMSPSTYTYVDLYQGDPLAEPPSYSMIRLNKSYAFNPVPPGVDSTYIMGGQANLWSERLHTVRHMQYMLWPRGWAVAESVWSPVAVKDWNSFVKRTEAHFKRWDFGEINYSTSMYDPIVNVKKATDSTILVSLSTELDGLDIHYSFDEFYPDKFYPLYKEPLLFPEGASTLKLSTYRNGIKLGKNINLPLVELRKRVRWQ